MREFATYAPDAFKDYTQKYDYYSGRHRPFITLALCDEALALWLLGMPFLGEDIGDGLDGDVLAAFARLTDTDVGDVDDLLLNPLFEDGITEFDRVAVLLLVLEHERPHAAAMIRRVPWVQEIMREAGLSGKNGPSEISFQYARRPAHYYSLPWLVEMAYSSPESLRALLELPWMLDQHVRTEEWLTDSDRSVGSAVQTVTIFVRHIAGKSDHGLASILRMPFLQTLEPVDLDILDILWETSDAGSSWTDGDTPIQQLLSDPSLEGGITNDNAGDVALADLRVRNPALSSELDSLSWIRDGVSPSENSGILSLWKLEHLGAGIVQSVVRLQWVADGLSRYESSAIRSLEQLVIAARNSKSIEGHSWHVDYVMTIPKKPFMSNIGPSEAALLRSTDLLFQDDKLRERPDLLSDLLESGETQKAERIITLPLAGEVALSVVWPAGIVPDRTVRLGVSVSRTMEIFEKAVRASEELMGLPFPQKQAIALIHNFPNQPLGSHPLGSGGRNAFVTIDPTVSDSVYVITHEVAHAYWWGGPSWIDEGAADFTESWASGRVPESFRSSCRQFDTIYDFVRALERDLSYRGCSYSLGQGMFVDLYNNLGEDAFRRGFSDLYPRILGFVPSEGCGEDIDEGACHLKAAFVDSAAPADAAVAERIINRRYYGTSTSTSH